MFIRLWKLLFLRWAVYLTFHLWTQAIYISLALKFLIYIFPCTNCSLFCGAYQLNQLSKTHRQVMWWSFSKRCCSIISGFIGTTVIMKKRIEVMLVLKTQRMKTVVYLLDVSEMFPVLKYTTIGSKTVLSVLKQSWVLK